LPFIYFVNIRCFSPSFIVIDCHKGIASDINIAIGRFVPEQ
jgi:hypothetical protein